MAGSVGGAIGSVVGGIAGNAASAGARGEANNQQVIANDILKSIAQAPDISKPLILEKYKQAGVLTPEMEQYITAQQPKAVTTDPRLKDAQMSALNQMQQRATGGLTAGDRAALHQAQLGAQQDTTSRLASIQQQAAMRGQAGGGSELAAQLMAAQSGANLESNQADQLAMQQQAAREAAAGQLGQFSSGMQAQDFGQQFQQQQAQNEMNRFNTANQISQQQRNVGAANQAQAGNLALAQNVSNMNVGGQNAELNNQLQREMSQYNANKDTAQVQSGGASRYAQGLNQTANQQANAQQQLWTGIGGLAGMAAGGIGGGGAGGASGGESMNSAGGMHGQDYLNYAAPPGDWQGGKINDYGSGGHVPGQAQHSGDHPSNDKVHAMLSPGEIVVPRTLAESKLGRQLVKLIDAHNNLKRHVGENG